MTEVTPGARLSTAATQEIPKIMGAVHAHSHELGTLATDTANFAKSVHDIVDALARLIDKVVAAQETTVSLAARSERLGGAGASIQEQVTTTHANVLGVFTKALPSTDTGPQLLEAALGRLGNVRDAIGTSGNELTSAAREFTKIATELARGQGVLEVLALGVAELFQQSQTPLTHCAQAERYGKQVPQELKDAGNELSRAVPFYAAPLN